MTQVALTHDGGKYTVSCSGHATGSVEVCAAISCLVYTLAGWLHCSGCNILHEQLEPGDALLQFAADAQSGVAFELICTGFLQLEAQYGAYIRVERRRK